jgi:hypothetical protein
VLFPHPKSSCNRHTADRTYSTRRSAPYFQPPQAECRECLSRKTTVHFPNRKYCEGSVAEYLFCEWAQGPLQRKPSWDCGVSLLHACFRTFGTTCHCGHFQNGRHIVVVPVWGSALWALDCYGATSRVTSCSGIRAVIQTRSLSTPDGTPCSIAKMEYAKCICSRATSDR